MKLSPYLLCFVAAGLVAAFAQVLLKKSAAKQHSSFISEYLNPYVIIGYMLMVVGMFLGVWAYRHVDFKNGPVMESLGFLWVMILSRIFFGEKMTLKKILGNVLILAGIAAFYLF